MTFSINEDQVAIKTAISKICNNFSPDYWLDHDNSGEFPQEFVTEICDAVGWFGIAMPEEYGGSGLGMTEASLMMQTITESGAGYTGASSVHLNLFGLHPIVVFGTEEQKQRMLPHD